MFQKIFKLISAHKIIFVLALCGLIVGGYYGYKALKSGETEIRYVLASVEKGTLVVSVAGSGQVAASETADIKPKVSGDVTYVGAKLDDAVKAGALIARLDAKDAEKSVETARTNLANAETALKNLQADKIKKEEALDTAYKDALNVLASAFQKLAPMMPELKAMFRESSYGGSESDIDFYLRVVRVYNENSDQLSYWAGDTERKYLTAQTAFDAARTKYWALNQNSPRGQIETALNQAYDMSQLLLDLTRQSFNLLQKYLILIDTQSLIPPISAAKSNTQFSNLDEYVSLAVTHSNALYSAISSISDKKEAIANAALDIESQYDVIKQKKDALADAEENLALHSVRAPFDGVVAKVNVKKGDSVTTATALATVITRQKIAEITLNEIDAAKVKAGQKATVAFDAIEGLSVAGEVIEVDAIGTVSQGVVTYGVKIAFDAGDERVKPGMSVSVSVIVEAKTDILLVPNSAVKSSAAGQYVEILVSGSPQVRAVETGLSNDIMTEITSGLNEGDRVITQTISGTVSSQTRSTGGNTFRIPGIGGFGR